MMEFPCFDEIILFSAVGKGLINSIDEDFVLEISL